MPSIEKRGHSYTTLSESLMQQNVLFQVEKNQLASEEKTVQRSR